MKKRGRHKAGFFKSILSMLLITMLIIGNLGIGSVGAKPDTENADAAAMTTSTENSAEKSAKSSAAEPAANLTNIDFSAYQNKGLVIYNHLHYTNANGEVILSGGGYNISGNNVGQDGKAGQEIVIGNHPTADGGDTAPLDKDIPVILKKLTATGAMTIKPVGADNSKTVKMTISENSSLGSLTVEENARLELILNADLNADSIILGNNSTLTVTGTGTLTVSGEFSSRGTVALNGGNIQANGGISTVNLSLSGATVTANGKSIAAKETLSMKDSTVKKASLFGYKADAAGGGALTLTLSGDNKFSDVTAVGCAADSPAIVSIAGIDTVSSSSETTYYCDYTITYKSGEDIIEAKAEWPVAYRTSYSSNTFNNGTICGYHTADSSFTESSSVPLPADSLQPGYEHKGWKTGDSEAIVSAITEASGNVTLSAVLEAGAVTVKLDRGYAPDKYTNDKDADGNLPERISTMNSKLDGTVSLSVPERFGYKFAGWKVTSGTNERVIFNSDGAEAPYKVELADCIMDGETSVVTMEAQWEKDTFNLTLFLGNNVTLDDNLEISVDGGKSFQKYRELKVDGTPPGTDGVSGATSNVDFSIEGRSINFTEKWPITYGEIISEYLRRVFPELPEGELPILRDTRTGGTSQNFVGWSAAGAVDGKTRFVYGENGMLTPGSYTLAEYQNALHENNATMSAVWGIMSYDLILPDSMPEGWSLTYTGPDGKRHSVEAGDVLSDAVRVQQGSVVTLTTSAVKPKNFSLWGFTKGEGSTKLDPSPQEQVYQSGDSQLNYQFIMPAAKVKATYHKGQEIWIDISKSPIMFEENVSYNNRTCNGFWYADKIDEMTPLFYDDNKTLSGTRKDGSALDAGAYFYQWDFADKFCVTSNNVATKNQLTLVNAMTGGVYFKEVNLAIRDTYNDKASDSLIDDVDCESSAQTKGITPEAVEKNLNAKNVNLADYANIVIDNSKRQAYTTTLNFKGQNNIVGAIMQDKLRASSSNKNFLTITGETRDQSAVKLGAAFGNFRHTVSDITITEYTKDSSASAGDFKYLLYSVARETGFKVTNADIKAPHKNLHAGALTNTSEPISFNNSNVELYSICVFRGLDVLKGSYLRVRENVRLGHIPIYLAGSSKAVIDGNLEMNYHHWADSDSSGGKGITDEDGDNWLIVKGTFCDLANRSWKSGTLICNSLVFGRTGGIQEGTVITNQIMNQAVGFWKYDNTNHRYIYDKVGNSQTVAANKNGDDYPFVTNHQKDESPNTYTFSGGKIYLLGYYKTKDDAGKKIYDSAVKATNADNPVAAFMNPLLDGSTGDLKKSDLAVNTGDVLKAVKSSDADLKDNECVVLGNSSYEGQRRTVEISGDTEIYAAGNITFYNDTTVSGKTVYCNGSFGSKGDLTIAGSNITATAVGNAYNLTTTLTDGTVRWKRTDIKDGTVTADRIGAFEKRVSDEAAPSEADQPKSTVTISSGATINNTPEICHDVYINYIFDSKLFNNDREPKNQNSLRFETTWQTGRPFAEQGWTNDERTFTAPNVIGEADAAANWNWDSLTGSKVDGVSALGNAQAAKTDITENQKAYDRIQMKLYASKDKYNLIFKDGADQISGVTCGGKAEEPPQANGDTISAGVDGKVVLKFKNPAMAKDYSVLWYIDGSNIIRSVMPDRSVEGQISFTMPRANVEIYAAKEVALDFDIASYTLLQDGFRTEANEDPKREDSEFHYMGNLVIHQASVENIEFDNFDNAKPEYGTVLREAPRENQKTRHMILVDEAFDNSENGRTVTLRHIYQDGTPTSYGIELQDRARAKFLLDGAVQICRIRVPEHADLTLDGKNNDPGKDAIYAIVNGSAQKRDDWASIGNWNGKAGNITLRDLTLIGRSKGASSASAGVGMWGSLCYSGKPSSNTVTYKNCAYRSAWNGADSKGWYNRSYFACQAGTVIFDECSFDLTMSNDWPGYFCDGSKDVFIRNGSTITVRDNGADDNEPSNTFYAKINNKLEIEDATLNLSLRVQKDNDSKTYRNYQNVNRIPPIELKGNANLVLEQHARLKNLTIGGSSTVKVGTNGDGYLLCENIALNDSASLEAGGIIVSGFYDAKEGIAGELKSENDFLTAMRNGTKTVLNGSGYKGLVVNGGKVTAKEYITGDVNGKLTVNGGTVSAPAIGTTGKLYGYTMYVPKAGEKYIYTYEKIPEGMNININDGTVNILNGKDNATGYLGGMKANVNINGGKVHLADNAVIGLTDEQQKTLTDYLTANGQKPENFGSLTVKGGTVEGDINEAAQKGGSIQVPYGTVSIFGENTAVSVYNMMAYCGKMTISGATGNGKRYDNPYEGSDRITGHEKLGIYVAQRMSAKSLTITDGSVVYANYAYANVPKNEEGNITVSVDDVNRAYLYTTSAYGVIGEGSGSYDYNDGTGGSSGIQAPGAKNVFGTKVVDVHYEIQPGNVFLDGDKGKEENPNMDNKTGLPYYTVVADNAEPDVRYYKLKDASCSGYKFLGWYEYDPEKKAFKEGGEKVERIDKANAKAVYLGAKWEKVDVIFEVQIEVDESEYNKQTMEYVREGNDGQKVYKFKNTATIEYGDPILTADGIVLANYTTNTLGVKSVTYKGTPIEKESSSGEYVPNTRVSPQMADDFVNGGNAPLVLMVPKKSQTTLNALIYLDQNRDGKGHPKDTSFNLKEGNINAGDDESNQVSAYGKVTSTLGSIAPFANSANRDDGLIHPTAPGYTFGGWYTNAACTGERVTADTMLSTLQDAHTTRLYAKWMPNIYNVRFSAKDEADETIADGDKRWVTADNEAPDAAAATNGFEEYSWVYDAAPADNEESTDGNCVFWVSSDASKEPKTELPRAWREGYKFDCWHFTDSQGKVHEVTDQDQLSKVAMDTLDVNHYVGFGSDTPALTLYAKYSKVEVTYDLNGGRWMTEKAPTANPDYGNALAGYIKESEIGSGVSEADADRLGMATDAGGTKYCVVSTKSDYFTDKADYVAGDYRNSLSRKGYTFRGWEKKGREDSGEYYGCTPRFEDIELKAKWTANVYNLKLHVKDKEYKNDDGTDKYKSSFSKPDPSVVDIPNVTVGDKISAENWPERTVWYAYNRGETDSEKHRLLLGATFAGLDPGDSTDTDGGSVYLRYAKAVTNMLNSGTLFENGDTFILPEDKAYSADLADAVRTRDKMSSVPDYPTGSVIPMYGVYRERSLVFIEKYVDGNGVIQSKVMYTHPWSEYTNYPYDESKDGYRNDPQGKYAALTGSGYALAGWYVGSEVIDSSREYPKDSGTFNANIQKWKDATTDREEYDINVYTAYVAQQTIEQNLEASDVTDLTDGDPPRSSASYTLPGSMQEGELSYQVSDLSGILKDDLNLVSKYEMEQHQYDTSWEKDGKTYSADDTVAIELKLENSEGRSYTVDLTDGGPHKLGKSGESSYQHIGKGWNLTLTLYHSRVMTANNTYNFNIDYTFEKGGTGDNNTLKDQKLKDKVRVTLKPSVYDVEYRVNLPEAKDKLSLTQPENAFTEVTGEDAYSYTVKQAYNSELLAADKTLTLEGYDRQSDWSYSYGTGSEKKAAALKNLMLKDDSISGLSDQAIRDELIDGRITVQTGYDARTYDLRKDTENPVPETWTITYGDGAGDADTDGYTELDDKIENVKYHSTVRFKATGDQPPEYIVLTFGSGEGGEPETKPETKRLNECATKQEDDGSYTLAMPARNVTVSYSDVRDLYLDNGTIELFPDGFRQAGVYDDKVTWPGNYRIWQNAENNIYENNDELNFHQTENVLKLYGDLSERKISLGNLNLSSQNSIELMKKDEEGNEISTEAKLTQDGRIKARNILVPSTADLTVRGGYDKVNPDKNKTIELEPSADRAAVGAARDDVVNGNITLNNVDLTMSLRAPSESSGIGSGTRDAVNCGDVTIANSRITVKERAGVAGQYKGTWIGGAGVHIVNISGTTIAADADNDNHGAKAVDGAEVNLTSCMIGDSKAPITEPVHAVNALNIEKCKIYQQNEYALGGVSMIGTSDSGRTTIRGSKVHTDYINRGSTDKLFTGQMVIEDILSNININGTRIMEVSHGDIKIEKSKATQSGVVQPGDPVTDVAYSSASPLNYLLLEERDPSGAAPKLTVAGLDAGKTITVQQPIQPSKDVTVGTLTVGDNAKLILDGNLIVTGKASVAGNKTLTVESRNAAGEVGAANGYGVTYRQGLAGDGNYIQNGGSLTGRADVVVGGDMTLTDVTADCTDHKLGSNGGSAPTADVGGTATTVTVNGKCDITAAVVGACGAHNDTFTFVELADKDKTKIRGKLVQDHYRLEYKTGGIEVDLEDAAGKPLPTVLRTETAYDGSAGAPDVLYGKPADPQGADKDQFLCWYIWNADGSARLGLAEGTDVKAGLNANTLLAGDTESSRMSEAAADGTRTLSVYAWLKPSGKATIAKGRLFEKLNSSAGVSAKVSKRGAWTAMLESNCTYISGRDYQISFENQLPVGTDLTLTVLADSGNRYYHYTLTEAKNIVRFSEFTRMGTESGVPPTFAGSEATKETFLLSADFAELEDGTAPIGGEIEFSVIPEDGTPMAIYDAAGTDTVKVNYNVEAVRNGEITANTSTVTVKTPPSGEERRDGKKLYLVGTLSKNGSSGQQEVKVPLNATAGLTASGTTIKGRWISGDTVSFELGSYGSPSIDANTAYTCSFKSLPESSYSIEWRLCTGEELNMTNGICSNRATGSITAVVETRPMLKVTSRAGSKVLAAGESREMSFDYETTADSFTVTVEKQTILAKFNQSVGTAKTVDVNKAANAVTGLGTVKALIPAAEGTYRVCFSMDESSDNDNIYYTFIVE